MKNFSRIKISNASTYKLRALKGKTGLTPNILCRFALCHSLENHSYNEMVPLTEDGQEFNRFTLTGEYDLYFVSLIKQKCIEEGFDIEEDFMKLFKFHLNNGIEAINGRIKDLGDLINLIKND